MKHADPDIHAINLHRGIVVLDCGAIVPITNMFDVMNEETHDLEGRLYDCCWTSRWQMVLGGGIVV